MESEDIERISDKSDENKHKELNENEKSANEEEEESEKINEVTQPKTENFEKKDENPNENKNGNDTVNKQEEKEIKNETIDLYTTTTYILKYKRSEKELKIFATETNLPKSENCIFMINIKILKNDSITNMNNSTNEENDVNKEKDKEQPKYSLDICCHEIAAIYFDEIYERIYTLEDLSNENIFFKVFDDISEARNIIDESIKNNEKNSKKVFIVLKDNELKLHMKLSFFDKEKEIIFNIPKKTLTDKDKNNLLPEFLKEIQGKINRLKEENKKLKAKKTILESSKGGSDFLIETEIKNDNDEKIRFMDENIELKSKNNNNDESKSLRKKIIKKKIKKKVAKEPAKKEGEIEGNFF